MAFQVYAYSRDDGEIQRIRLQPETAAAGDFTSAVGFTLGGFVKVSKTNREFGIRPRGVRLSRVDGNATRYRFLPVATASAQTALLDAGTVTIGSTSWTVTSTVGEDF